MSTKTKAVIELVKLIHLLLATGWYACQILTFLGISPQTPIELMSGRACGHATAHAVAGQIRHIVALDQVAQCSSTVLTLPTDRPEPANAPRSLTDQNTSPTSMTAPVGQAHCALAGLHGQSQYRIASMMPSPVWSLFERGGTDPMLSSVQRMCSTSMPTSPLRRKLEKNSTCSSAVARRL